MSDKSYPPGEHPPFPHAHVVSLPPVDVTRPSTVSAALILAVGQMGVSREVAAAAFREMFLSMCAGYRMPTEAVQAVVARHYPRAQEAEKALAVAKAAAEIVLAEAAAVDKAQDAAARAAVDEIMGKGRAAT